uniref:ABC1 atypical kinase-like domain-containing protein n=1 Tax=Photinus pyralis TaxID=7054 RepID=A0A1Y1MDT0_PHOPY
MNRFKFRTILKYGALGGLAVGTFFSLRTNDYQVDSIGVVRLSRAAAAVFDITSVYKKKLYKSDLDKNSQEYHALTSSCHKEAAEKLLQLCCTNKGVYIKVGQHIAALDYLVPEEYVQTMKILHSQAPSSTIQDVYKVLKEDLKRNPHEIFKSIELEPLGTASLAQVHKAVLHDGTTLAIKVQHAYVQGNSRVDMKTMEILVKIMGFNNSTSFNNGIFGRRPSKRFKVHQRQ